MAGGARVSGVLYLAWRYLLWHRWKTAILVLAVTLVVYLPLGLQLVVQQTATDMTARADRSPLLLGSRGSPLELVLAALYFDKPQPEITRMSQVNRIEEMDQGTATPLYTAIRVGATPIIGTTTTYFALRDLQLARGRAAEIPGECMVGAKAATRLEVGVGDKLPLSSQTAFAHRARPG